MPIKWLTAGTTSTTTSSHPPPMPSKRIESQKSPIAVPTPPVNIPPPQIQPQVTLQTQLLPTTQNQHQAAAPQPQRPTPIPPRPRRLFIPPKWHPLPARIHTHHEDITHYYAPGTRGWEESHCRRVLEAELRVGEIDNTWAGGVVRDFRAELVEWARLVAEEGLGELGELGGWDGDSVDGRDGRDGREEEGRKREHEERVDENAVAEEEAGDESGWHLWTSTERMLARMGRRRRAI